MENFNKRNENPLILKKKINNILENVENIRKISAAIVEFIHQKRLAKEESYQVKKIRKK